MAIYTSGIICRDAIVEENTGILSAVRIVDHVVVDIPQPIPSGSVIAYPVPFFVIIVFKSDAPEEFEMVFSAIRPDGKRKDEAPVPIRTGGGPHGHNVRIRIDMDPRLVGTWWFEVNVRGEVALRLPFSVIPPDQKSATR